MLARPQQSRLPRPPLWAQWVISLAVAATLIVLLVLFVTANSGNYSVAKLLPSAVQRADQQDEVLTAQDQAPHLVALGSAGDPRGELVHAIRSDMLKRISSGQIDGTLQRASCRRTGGAAGAPAFACLATAASVNYMYAGVVHVGDRQLVWCRHDEPPVPGRPVALSLRCT
ncbi:MAG: hypothetical protein ACRDL5_03545 [Solirubrobacteraceae bacterium]